MMNSDSNNRNLIVSRDGSSSPTRPIVTCSSGALETWNVTGTCYYDYHQIIIITLASSISTRR